MPLPPPSPLFSLCQVRFSRPVTRTQEGAQCLRVCTQVNPCITVHVCMCACVRVRVRFSQSLYKCQRSLVALVFRGYVWVVVWTQRAESPEPSVLHFSNLTRYVPLWLHTWARSALVCWGVGVGVGVGGVNQTHCCDTLALRVLGRTFVCSNVTAAHVKEICGRYGPVKDVDLAIDKARGVAKVCFAAMPRALLLLLLLMRALSLLLILIVRYIRPSSPPPSRHLADFVMFVFCVLLRAAVRYCVLS
jgi:hypothetical protein